MNPNRRELVKGFLLSTATVCLPFAVAQAVTTDFFESSETVWARWQCQLNCFRWPVEWGQPPEWIREKFSKSGRECYETYRERYAALTQSIKAMTTKESIARVWREEFIRKEAK